jgi:hypothetical protein
VEPSNENLEEALEDIRHRAAGIRDELLERLSEPAFLHAPEPDPTLR